MEKILVVANQKGGVGKTTTAVNLGAALADRGKSTLLIDFDPQSNLSSSVGADTEKPGIYEAIMGRSEIVDSGNRAVEADRVGPIPCSGALFLGVDERH